MWCRDLLTGSIHQIWYGLTYDLSTVSAPMGPYPSFAFTPSDDAIIIWAAGQIYRVPLSTNQYGEKIGSLKETPSPIPFSAHIEKRLAETLKDSGSNKLVELETRDEERVLSFRNLQVDERGEMAVFEGAGVNYVHDVYEKETIPVPVSDPSAPYYSPAFVSGYEHLVLHARWSDTNFSTFELADFKAGTVSEISGLSLGRYYAPTLCGRNGTERTIAFVKTGGDYLSGNIVATANPGLYIGQLELPESVGTPISIANVRFVQELEIEEETPYLKLRFLDGDKQLLVQQPTRASLIDLTAGPNEYGEYPTRTLAHGRMSTELAVSVKGTGPDLVLDQVAFVDANQAYIVPGANVGVEPVWSKPGRAPKKLARVSLDGARDVVWSGDGKKLFWFLGA